MATYLFEHVMNSILVIVAHPNFGKSVVNKSLFNAISSLEHVKIHDLYQTYGDGIIDIDAEQALLEAADVVVFQHPFYWYSAPSLLKEWQDLVLQFNFAYGPKGTALKGKQWLSVISTGAGKDAYQTEGDNRFTMRELLRPFEQTAFLCNMNFLPPLIAHNSRELSKNTLELKALSDGYRGLLQQLQNDDFDVQLFEQFETMNQALER
jgi:glutathione-regulated potassium-efflux system ancillary protein KefG